MIEISKQEFIAGVSWGVNEKPGLSVILDGVFTLLCGYA